MNPYLCLKSKTTQAEADWALAVQFTDRAGGRRLAFQHQDGRRPTVVWLCGFASDMAGTKAEAVAQWAGREGQACLRFDYSGHGRSEGAFEDGTISGWKADVLHMLDTVVAGPTVLVGSSMGAWLAMLAALARPERTAGLLLIAPATDFTARLMKPGLPAEALEALKDTGRWVRPSAYDTGGYAITQALLDDGEAHRLLEGPIPLPCPTRILQGQQDPDVPWRHALDTAAAITRRDVRVTLIKDGDHRLSRSQDIALLLREVAQLVADVSS